MTVFNSNFFRKRWLDFRNGHSIYLAFLLNMVNFVLITYNFAIVQVPALKGIAGSVITFTIIFIGMYVPAAMVIGYWHRRQQYRVENETMLAENWIWAWMTRYQILLIEGKTTPDENKEVLNYLENILRRHKMDHFINSKASNGNIDSLPTSEMQTSKIDSIPGALDKFRTKTPSEE